MPIWKLINELAGREQEPQTVAAGGGTSGGDTSGGGAASRSGAASSTAFTMAVIALGAKMAAADGVVVPIEIEAFHRVFKTDAGDRDRVDQVFALAQADVAGFDAYAGQVRRLLDGDAALLREVLASLFYIASADRLLHPKEDAFLKQVAEIFGLSDSEWRHIRAQVVEDRSSPYDVLGLTPGDSDAEITRRYRKLVRENHPDLLMGRGVPEKLIVVANRKLAAITQAYAAIAKERKL